MNTGAVAVSIIQRWHLLRASHSQQVKNHTPNQIGLVWSIRPSGVSLDTLMRMRLCDLTGCVGHMTPSEKQVIISYYAGVQCVREI